MQSYRSLRGWQHTHRLCVDVLRATDAAYHPRALDLFRQIRRAAVSVVANLVEGYALQTPRLFRRHLRIAVGSLAELECLLNVTDELSYLDADTIAHLGKMLSETFPVLIGLQRSVARRADAG